MLPVHPDCERPMGDDVKCRVLTPEPYDVVDHTADLGVRVRGASREEALARLLLAHGQVLGGGAPVPVETEVELDLAYDELPLLAVDALRAAQGLFDRRRLLVGCVTVERFDDAAVALRLGCGAYDEVRHAEGLELKAVTYHAAVFAPEGDGWVAQVIFDV